MTLEELFEENHASLFRFLSRMTNDPELAKDIVQETFLTVAAKQVPSDRRSRGWLFQLARNLALSQLRKRRRRLRLFESGVHRLPSATPDPPPDVQAERAEVKDAVRLALGALSERDRTILLMREEGFTHREIAEAVSTTTGSVGTLFARALGKLEAHLSATRGEGP